MEDNYVEDAGNQASVLDSPVVEGSADRVDMNEDDLQNVKINLNRSVSCGSILQNNSMNEKRNFSRRVSFPSDDKLISGYNEPKNPWEHAQETTTEDLIQAYTEACQTWNVRPISKLLLQLQEIKDFTVRANSLTLKGEKLEMRVVETLESIFKRVQFITIDLEATNLDEDAGASLFDMIEYYESAVNVLVGFNKNLGNRGWQAAAHMMRKMSCLRLFDGHSVPLSIQASPFVGRALRLSNTLVTLHLENAMLSGRPVLLIIAALRMNTTLRELFLADNRLSPLDALQLANLLKFNRILQLLDLRNNPIQDMGLGHLCSGLMAAANSTGYNGTSGGLQTLVLWNNQLSCEGMPNLARALRYTTSLATLNLGQNVLTDDGVFRLKDGLLQNHSLLRLGLVGTKLTDEGAVAIAEYLAESPRIIRLDLRNNDIKVAGLMALSLAFKINYSLLRLDIDKPNKKDALRELAAKQESLMTDIVNYSTRNKQSALEKAQAAQLRLEEARRAQMKEESEIRYMDMTNASTATTSTSSTEQSANNSNNQEQHETKDEEDTTSSSDKAEEPSKHPPPNKEDDDSPEDSPEFLPRSSISYHQVSPVMLSNSEMAKRAAQVKLSPVHEHNEESPQIFLGSRVAGPANKLEIEVEGPNKLAEHGSHGGSHVKDSDVSLTVGADSSKPCENQGDIMPLTRANGNVPQLEGADLNKPTEDCVAVKDNVPMAGTADSDRPAVVVDHSDSSAEDSKNRGDTTSTEDIIESAKNDEFSEEGIKNGPSEISEVVTTVKDVDDGTSLLKGDEDTATEEGAKTSDEPSSNHPAGMSDPAREPGASLAETAGPVNKPVSSVDISTEIKLKTAEPGVMEQKTISEHSGSVDVSVVTETNVVEMATEGYQTNEIDKNETNADKNQIKNNEVSATTTVSVATDDSSENQFVDSESSGFATEDNSVLSGDLSPCDVTDKQIIGDLLSPDSGVGEYDNGDKSKIFGDVESVTEGASIVQTPNMVVTDPTPDTPIENTIHHQSITQPQIDSKNKQYLGENTKNDDYSAGDVTPNAEIVKNISQDINSAPCEIEVSHFDLNEFPSSG